MSPLRKRFEALIAGVGSATDSRRIVAMTGSFEGQDLGSAEPGA